MLQGQPATNPPLGLGKKKSLPGCLLSSCAPRMEIQKITLSYLSSADLK